MPRHPSAPAASAATAHKNSSDTAEAGPPPLLGANPGGHWRHASTLHDKGVALYTRVYAPQHGPVRPQYCYFALRYGEGAAWESPEMTITVPSTEALLRIAARYPQVRFTGELGVTNHPTAAACRGVCLLEALTRTTGRILDIGGAYARWMEVHHNSGARGVHLKNPRFGTHAAPTFAGYSSCDCEAPASCDRCAGFAPGVVLAQHSAYYRGVREELARWVYSGVRALAIVDPVEAGSTPHSGEVRVETVRPGTTYRGKPVPGDWLGVLTDSRVVADPEYRYVHPRLDWLRAGYEKLGERVVSYQVVARVGDSIVVEVVRGRSEPDALPDNGVVLIKGVVVPPSVLHKALLAAAATSSIGDSQTVFFRSTALRAATDAVRDGHVAAQDVLQVSATIYSQLVLAAGRGARELYDSAAAGAPMQVLARASYNPERLAAERQTALEGVCGDGSEGLDAQVRLADFPTSDRPSWWTAVPRGVKVWTSPWLFLRTIIIFSALTALEQSLIYAASRWLLWAAQPGSPRFPAAVMAYVLTSALAAWRHGGGWKISALFFAICQATVVWPTAAAAFHLAHNLWVVRWMGKRSNAAEVYEREFGRPIVLRKVQGTGVVPFRLLLFRAFGALRDAALDAWTVDCMRDLEAARAAEHKEGNPWLVFENPPLLEKLRAGPAPAWKVRTREPRATAHWRPKPRARQFLLRVKGAEPRVASSHPSAIVAAAYDRWGGEQRDPGCVYSERACRTLMAAAGPAHPEPTSTFDRYLDDYTPAKAELLREGWLLPPPERNRLLVHETFVKKEAANPTKTATKARLIVVSPPQIACRIGTYIAAAERWCEKHLTRDKSLWYAVYADGLELGLNHTEMIDRGVRWMMEDDGANWEGTQTASHLRVGALLAHSVVADPAPPEAAALVGPTKLGLPGWADVTLELTFMPSGRRDTTYTNTTANLALTAVAAAAAGVEVSAVAVGDDGMSYIRSEVKDEDVQDLQAAWMASKSANGHPMTGGFVAVREVTFCSRLFWPCEETGGARYILAPLPGRAIHKLGLTFLPGASDTILGMMCGTMSQLRPYVAVVPFLRVVVAWALRVTDGFYKGKSMPLDGNPFRTDRERVARPRADEEETWALMRARYGDRDWREEEENLRAELEGAFHPYYEIDSATLRHLVERDYA